MQNDLLFVIWSECIIAIFQFFDRSKKPLCYPSMRLVHLYIRDLTAPGTPGDLLVWDEISWSISWSHQTQYLPTENLKNWGCIEFTIKFVLCHIIITVLSNFCNWLAFFKTISMKANHFFHILVTSKYLANTITVLLFRTSSWSTPGEFCKISWCRQGDS